jgi:hypothetical protein
LNSTLIASAVESTDPGCFTFVLPSFVTPARSSWNIVTRSFASSAGASTPTW